MNRDYAKYALIGTVAIFFAACTSARYTILEPASQPLTDYDVLEIHDFTSSLTDKDSIALAGQFADRLHTALMEDRTERPADDRVFDQILRRNADRGRVLMLDGKVISFEKGSRAARYFVGFGAGKAYCTIQATFTDKATGEVVLKANFDGELGMGFFGGSPDEAVGAVVGAFIDYFDDYFEDARLAAS